MKRISLILVVAMLLSALPGIAAFAQEELPYFEYTYMTDMGATQWWADPSTDVVSQAIIEKFNINVKEILTTGSMTTDEKLTVLAAAEMLPDVTQIKTGTQAAIIKKMADSGMIAKLDDYITPEKTPNLYQYVSEEFNPVDFLRSFSSDGGLYGFPQVAASGKMPRVEGAAYQPMPMLPWNIIVRSDILKQLGYKFKSYAELREELKDDPRPLTLDDLQVDPPIATPDDLYNLLKQIQALELEVEGNKVMPFTIHNWHLYHLGSMFGSCLWSEDPSGEINGYLGHDYAKDYWQFVRKLYQEGLLDPDFALLNDEQFIQKGANGLIGASLFWCAGDATIFDGIVQTNPDWEYYRLAMPHLPDVKPYTDEQIPAGTIFMIREGVEDIERLVQYFDWFYSDEAFDLITWGPESAGLYEVVDGVKRFKDDNLWDLIKNGVTGEQGYDYYGLYCPSLNDRPGSRSVSAVPFMQYFNPLDSRLSYPYENDFFNEPFNLLGAPNAAVDGSMMSDGSDAANAVQAFFWADWLGDCAPLYTAQTDEEFDQAWDYLYNRFITETDYEAAKESVTKNYNARQGK